MRHSKAVLAVALLILVLVLRAPPIIAANVPCTLAEGCPSGGSFQVPEFFRGYATQGSAGVNYPAGSDPWNPAFGAASSRQPATYPVRPPWQVAGVDYPVGMPLRLLPPLDQLAGQPALKDPADIARDPLVNPRKSGENCQFYRTNTDVAHGVPAGTTSAPFPFPNGGPGIYCSNATGSVGALIFDGYNFAWNSATGFGAVPVYIAARQWGSGAAHDSPETAAIVIRNSLFVVGPQCNIWGGIGHGKGTAGAGPESPGNAACVRLVSSTTAGNTFAFVDNTVYGCGGDRLASALERALCAATFNATAYHAGSVADFVKGATVGVAPENSLFMADEQPVNGAQSWIEYNAFLHMPGHLIDFNNANVGGTQINFRYNYIEGMLYKPEPNLPVASIVNSGGTQETVTTTTPHGVAPGGYVALVLAGAGAAGFPAGWAGTWTFQATGPNTLVTTSATDFGNWTYPGSGPHPAVNSNFAHGELTTIGSRVGDATFTGTIRGTTLTVANRNGTLAAGQYVTATTGSGMAIASPTYIVSGSGDTWTLNRAPGDMAGPMASPLHTIGAQGGPIAYNFSYNTYLATPSTWGYGGTTVVFLSGTPGGLGGLPLHGLTGSVDHNILVSDLQANSRHRQASWTLEAQFTQLDGFSITDNYVDPTGNFGCWADMMTGPSRGVRLAGNVNLLSGSDPFINAWDQLGIVPYLPGTDTNTQGENGLSYDAATGVVTMTLPWPVPFGPGQRFHIVTGTVTTGTNYLAGPHTATSVSGNSVTFNVGAGHPGTPNARFPRLVLETSGGESQGCYGHN